MSEGKKETDEIQSHLGRAKMLGRKLWLLAQRSCNATLSALSPLQFQARSLCADTDPGSSSLLPSRNFPLSKPKDARLLMAKKVMPQLSKEPSHPQEVRTAQLWASSGTRGGYNSVLASSYCCWRWVKSRQKQQKGRAV